MAKSKKKCNSQNRKGDYNQTTSSNESNSRSNNRSNNSGSSGPYFHKGNGKGNRNPGQPTTDYQSNSLSSNGNILNDWRWYAHSESQLNAYAQLNFNSILGSVDPRIHGGKRANIGVADAVPGIMALYTIGIPGIATGPMDPVNEASSIIGEFMRSKVSGERNYDSANIMQYILCVKSMLALHGFLKRAYGLLGGYTQLNQYTPKALIHAMGLSYDDLVKNKENFYGVINEFGNSLRSYPIPDIFSLVTRECFMYTEIFTDAQGEKCQYYMYSPAGFYQYDIAPLSQDPPEPAQLKFKPLRAFATPGWALMGFEDICEYINEIRSAFANQVSSWAQIIGDIIRSYDGKFFRISEFTQDYKIQPVYSEELSSQIENAIVHETNSLWTTMHFDIKEVVPSDTSLVPYLTCAPFVQNTAQTAESWLMNFHNGHPTPADIMVSSRCMSIPSVVTDFTTSSKLLTAGSEVVVRGSIWQYRQITATSVPELQQADFSSCMLLDLSSTTGYESRSYANVLRIIPLLSAFDWHPIIYPGVKGKESTTPQECATIGNLVDYNEYRFLSNAEIANLNKCALLSEFGIPVDF